MSAREPEGMEQPQPWPAKLERFVKWFKETIADHDQGWRYPDRGLIALDAQEFMAAAENLMRVRNEALGQLEEALRERDALAAAMPAEQADVALALAVAERQRDEALRERDEAMRVRNEALRLRDKARHSEIAAELRLMTVLSQRMESVPVTERERDEALRQRDEAQSRLARLENAATAVLDRYVKIQTQAGVAWTASDPDTHWDVVKKGGLFDALRAALAAAAPETKP